MGGGRKQTELVCGKGERALAHGSTQTVENTNKMREANYFTLVQQVLIARTEGDPTCCLVVPLER